MQTKAWYVVSLSNLHYRNINVTGAAESVCLGWSFCYISAATQRTRCLNKSTCYRCIVVTCFFVYVPLHIHVIQIAVFSAANNGALSCIVPKCECHSADGTVLMAQCWWHSACIVVYADLVPGQDVMQCWNMVRFCARWKIPLLCCALPSHVSYLNLIFCRWWPKLCMMRHCMHGVFSILLK